MRSDIYGALTGKRARLERLPWRDKVAGMPVWPLMLRVLLTLAMIVNGAGFATASVHLHLASSVPTPDAALPCHESADTSWDASAAQTASPQGEASDCCGGDGCNDACGHHGHFAMLSSSQRSLGSSRAVVAQAIVVVHGPPGLLHPIRPPIT